MTLRQYLSHRMLIFLLSARVMSDALPFLYVSITYRMTCLRNRHCAAAGRVEHGHAHAAITQGGFGQANQSSSSVAPRQLCRDTLVIVHVGDVRYAHSCKRCRGSPRLASGPSVFLLLSPRALSSQRTNKGGNISGLWTGNSNNWMVWRVASKQQVFFCPCCETLRPATKKDPFSIDGSACSPQKNFVCARTLITLFSHLFIAIQAPQ